MMMIESLSQVAKRPFDLGVAIFSLSLLGYISFRAICLRRDTRKGVASQYPLPPGPPRDFLIGSMRYFPTSNLWKGFCEWQRSYGDIVYAHLPGLSFVMLNSYEMCQELLSKRTSGTSGRDAGYMAMTVMKLNWMLSLIQPGVHHSNQRKMIRRGIGPSTIGSYDPRVERITCDFMLRLAKTQGYVPDIVMEAMSQVIIEVAYGEEIWKRSGKMLSDYNHEIMHLAEIGLFNVWAVDFVHILRFIPSWVPGATFKRIGERSTWLSDFIRYKPFEMVKELYSSGQIGQSMASDLLEEFGPNGDVQDALAVLYTAGSETTRGAISSFLYNIFLFSEVADKVFQEIQHVTNGQRLLHISDRPSLTYTEAVWKESIRWKPFFTLGIPHVNSEEEIIQGFRIPKGTVIGQNIGFMLIDPKVWGDPEIFRPERFLSQSNNGAEACLPNPSIVVFGFGSREQKDMPWYAIG
ncbi:hypothetical protein FRC19_011600 [Serendipita sp. 401]|nr:hypothetical protein FRC19_011600 [Serendipita sp. 401]